MIFEIDELFCMFLLKLEDETFVFLFEVFNLFPAVLQKIGALSVVLGDGLVEFGFELVGTELPLTHLLPELILSILPLDPMRQKILPMKHLRLPENRTQLQNVKIQLLNLFTLQLIKLSQLLHFCIGLTQLILGNPQPFQMHLNLRLCLPLFLLELLLQRLQLRRVLLLQVLLHLGKLTVPFLAVVQVQSLPVLYRCL
jgi:hypothetical protein